jgi:hypothetical protein
MKLSPVSFVFLTLLVSATAYILCVKQDKTVAKQENSIVVVNDTTNVIYEGTSGVVTINDSVIVVKMKRVK